MLVFVGKSGVLWVCEVGVVYSRMVTSLSNSWEHKSDGSDAFVQAAAPHMQNRQSVKPFCPP